MVICLERGADLHMAQLMPLPLTVSCFSKIEIGLPFWYRLTRVVPDKRPLNVCVCVCVLTYLLAPFAIDSCRGPMRRGSAVITRARYTHREADVHVFKPRHDLPHLPGRQLIYWTPIDRLNLKNIIIIARRCVTGRQRAAAWRDGSHISHAYTIDT